MKKYKKISMEFKITINEIDQCEEDKREYVKARLEDTIKRSVFEWRNSFTISSLEGYLNGYVEGLSRGEEILDKIIDKNK